MNSHLLIVILGLLKFINTDEILLGCTLLKTNFSEVAKIANYSLVIENKKKKISEINNFFKF